MADTQLISDTLKSTTNPLPSPTSFLHLPLELRLQIYTYLLLLPSLPALLARLPAYRHQHLHLPSSSPSSSSSSNTTPHVHPALLRTNHQIHDEATPILYTSNVFLAHHALLSSFPRLRAWYGPITQPSALRLVRKFHLCLRLDCDVPYTREAAAEAFTGVDELSIDLVQTMYMGSGCGNLTKFDGVRGVKVVRIVGSTTGFEDYVAWLTDAMMADPQADVPEYKPAFEGFPNDLPLVWR